MAKPILFRFACWFEGLNDILYLVCVFVYFMNATLSLLVQQRYVEIRIDGEILALLTMIGAIDTTLNMRLSYFVAGWTYAVDIDLSKERFVFGVDNWLFELKKFLHITILLLTLEEADNKVI